MKSTVLRLTLQCPSCGQLQVLLGLSAQIYMIYITIVPIKLIYHHIHTSNLNTLGIYSVGRWDNIKFVLQNAVHMTDYEEKFCRSSFCCA